MKREEMIMIQTMQKSKFGRFAQQFLGKIIISLAIFFFVGTAYSQARDYTGQPLVDFETQSFDGSGKCAICHHLITDEHGKSLSIHNYWRSTMMANAAKDPLWQAKVVAEVNSNPALKHVIEEKCVTCHMPMAYTEANNQNMESGFLPGFADSDNPLHQAAMDGVSCSLCHQLADYKLGEKDSFSGKYKVETAKDKPEKKLYGPFSNIEERTMRTSVGYQAVHGEHTLTSEFCATCHTLYTPYVNGDGEVVGTFPEQTPYLEWLQSIYGHGKKAEKHCQGCHMPIAKGDVKIAKYAPSDIDKKTSFAQHNFVGGNVHMLRLLRDNVQSLGLTASSKNLDETMRLTEVQLKEQTARISLVKVEIKSGKKLIAEVRIENRVGHKFPSGFPSRRAWIHFVVEGNDGTVVFESGRPVENATIVGNDNDQSPDLFEPHYDVITKEDQVQIYETIMANTDNNVTYTLLRAASYLKDNRLLPEGFDKKSVEADIAVYGGAENDEDFNGGGDLLTFQVEVEGFLKNSLTVRAELLFEPVSYPFIENLRQYDLNKVREFIYAWDKIDKTPVLVSSDQFVITPQ